MQNLTTSLHGCRLVALCSLIFRQKSRIFQIVILELLWWKFPRFPNTTSFRMCWHQGTAHANPLLPVRRRNCTALSITKNISKHLLCLLKGFSSWGALLRTWWKVFLRINFCQTDILPLVHPVLVGKWRFREHDYAAIWMPWTAHGMQCHMHSDAEFEFESYIKTTMNP